MSSTTRKIAPSEWEHHKDTIVELYLTRNKPLKDVRAEMQDQHGFDASSWQYEMQLKRWNIRKNATRSEWQQYFAANKDQPIANSLGDRRGTNLAPVILSKSTASKKRASRWASGSIVTPDSVASHAVLAPRVSDSTSPGDEGHLSHVFSLNGPIMAQRNTQPGFQDAFQNMVAFSHGTESFPLVYGPCSNNNFTLHSVLGSSSRVPETFTEALDTPANSLDLISLTCSVVPGLQPQVHGQNTVDLADFPFMSLPVENNMGTFILQDIRQILPFAQLEKSMTSRGMMLERPARHTIFGGSASRVLSGFLSREDQPMVRQTPDLKRFLNMLGAQIPGESSALITDDQAFETNFARALLFSVLNGFASLNDIPMESILRFLNRIQVNKLLLDVLEQSPRYVSRTLADNIFRAAIEATDTKVVNLLLNRKLVDVNETVCFHHTQRYTPIERASALRSLNLMKTLIDAGADVNKSHRGLSGSTRCGALMTLKLYDGFTSRVQEQSISSELVEAVEMLLSAGARVHLGTVLDLDRTEEFQFLIFQNARPENHRDYFRHKGSFIRLIESLDVRYATRLVQHLISVCHQADCNKCLAGFGYSLGKSVTRLAYEGKLGHVQLLFQEADIKPNLSQVFLAAIVSKKPALIDFILSLGPDLDPPAIKLDYESKRWAPAKRWTTPIAEAVRHGNSHLIRLLETEGGLDHLTEGGRFEAVVAAAAEAGNAAYMRKLLARAVTSKEAHRVTNYDLELALDGKHQDIAQMLLEAGAIGLRIRLPGTSIPEDVQLLRALIASGATTIDMGQHLVREDRSIVAVLLNEFPGLSCDHFQAREFLRKCIDTDILDFFREVLQTLDVGRHPLNAFLSLAVELGHISLVEYLLDLGVYPFHDSVLRAAIPDKPDMLLLLLQKERRRQTMPKCIGSRVLWPLMGSGAGNSEALDVLVSTGAINFARLQLLYDHYDNEYWRAPYEYREQIKFTPLGMVIEGVPGKFDSNMVAMRKFLEAGADPNQISKSTRQLGKGPILMTALMVAIESGRDDAVNMLLDYGADVNARPRIRTTRTALQFAAELGNMDMIKLLLSRGADVNSSASSRGGATALQFAAMTGNCNMAAYLLDHGAQLDALPSRIDGMWPLEGAAASGRLDMVRFLWELNVRAVAGGTFPDGFLERHCLRAMNFAREEGHIGCMYLISDLSGISVDRLETDEYGAPWIAY